MEFTSCLRMLHGQPTGSTEIETCDLYIQSVMPYLFGHHVSPIIYPITCVLKHKCTASVQSQIIKYCSDFLHGVGINVLTSLFDGCFKNQRTAKLLGCKMQSVKFN